MFENLTQEFIDFYNVYMGNKKPIKGYFSKEEIKEEIKRIESTLETITPSKLNEHLIRISTTSETMLQSTLLVIINMCNIDNITKTVLLKYTDTLKEIKELNKPAKIYYSGK